MEKKQHKTQIHRGRSKPGCRIVGSVRNLENQVMGENRPPELNSSYVSIDF